MIYICSPYSNNPEVNYKAVLSYVVEIFDSKGIVLFSPIIYGHTIAKKLDYAITWEYWEGFDFDMIKLCSELWVLKLDAWSESVGVKQEVAYAMSLNKKIEFKEYE